MEEDSGQWLWQNKSLIIMLSLGQFEGYVEPSLRGQDSIAMTHICWNTELSMNSIIHAANILSIPSHSYGFDGNNIAM